MFLCFWRFHRLILSCFVIFLFTFATMIDSSNESHFTHACSATELQWNKKEHFHHFASIYSCDQMHVTINIPTLCCVLVDVYGFVFVLVVVFCCIFCTHDDRRRWVRYGMKNHIKRRWTISLFSTWWVYMNRIERIAFMCACEFV